MARKTYRTKRAALEAAHGRKYIESRDRRGAGESAEGQRSGESGDGR